MNKSDCQIYHVVLYKDINGEKILNIFDSLNTKKDVYNWIDGFLKSNSLGNDCVIIDNCQDDCIYNVTREVDVEVKGYFRNSVIKQTESVCTIKVLQYTDTVFSINEKTKSNINIAASSLYYSSKESIYSVLQDFINIIINQKSWKTHDLITVYRNLIKNVKKHKKQKRE